MKDIIDVSNYLDLGELQKSQIEYDAYFNILKYILDNFKNDSDLLLSYEEKYIKAQSKLFNCKNKILFYLKDLCQNENFDWEINFEKQIAIISYKEG